MNPAPTPRHSNPDQVRRARPPRHPVLRGTRRSFLTFGGVALGAVGIAFAASLILGSNNLGAGLDTPPCPGFVDFSNDFLTTYDNTQARWEVGGVTIGSIPSNCYAETLTVRLQDSGGTNLTSTSGAPGAAAAVYTFPDDASRPVPSSVSRVLVELP